MAISSTSPLVANGSIQQYMWRFLDSIDWNLLHTLPGLSSLVRRSRTRSWIAVDMWSESHVFDGHISSSYAPALGSLPFPFLSFRIVRPGTNRNGNLSRFQFQAHTGTAATRPAITRTYTWKITSPRSVMIQEGLGSTRFERLHYSKIVLLSPCEVKVYPVHEPLSRTHGHGSNPYHTRSWGKGQFNRRIIPKRLTGFNIIYF